MNVEGTPGTKRFVKTSEACKIFGVSRPTLVKWEESGRIKVFRVGSIDSAYGGHRRIDISSYVSEDPGIHQAKREKHSERSVSIFDADKISSQESRPPIKTGFCYCRVSSFKQRDDLERQTRYLQSLYPQYTIIKDCGSGLNYKRRGLQKLIQNVIDRKVSEVVIAHKDRLCRFGFELFEWLFERFETKITILNNQTSSVEEELGRDILDIIHVFSCRRNGKRRYKEESKNQEAEGEAEDCREDKPARINVPSSDISATEEDV